MLSVRSIRCIVFLYLFRLVLCAEKPRIEKSVQTRHGQAPELEEFDVTRRSLFQGFSVGSLFVRSPTPQSSCYTCRRINGSPGCVPEGADCCPNGRYCDPGLSCCYGRCIDPVEDSCCATPGLICSNNYDCYIIYPRSSRSFSYPTCCSDDTCNDQAPFYVASGYETPRLPQPTSTRVVYYTYTRTVTWTYWYTYWIYIEVRRTTLLTSEMVTTSRIVSVSATASAEAEDELDSIAEGLSLETPTQLTTETRGLPSPPSTTSEEPEPPMTTDEPETTSTPRTSESSPGSRGGSIPPRSTSPPSFISTTLPGLEPPEPTANSTDSNTTLPAGGSGASAGTSRFEGLSGVGSGIMAVSVLFGLMMAMI